MSTDANTGVSRALAVMLFALLGVMLWMSVVQYGFVRDVLPMVRAVRQVDEISERLAAAVELLARVQQQAAQDLEGRVAELEHAVRTLQDRCPCGRSTDAGR